MLLSLGRSSGWYPSPTAGKAIVRFGANGRGPAFRAKPVFAPGRVSKTAPFGNKSAMTLLLILLIVLLVLAVGGGWGYGGGAYRGPGLGLGGVLLVIILILLLTGALA